MSDDEDDALEKILVAATLHKCKSLQKTVKLIHDLWWIFFKYFED